MRSLVDLTKHLTARADDSHASPVTAPRRVVPLSLHYHRHVNPWQGSARRLELNHTLRCLCGSPSIPLSFNLAAVVPRRLTCALAPAPAGLRPSTPSQHRLRLGLPGFLIPFAPLAFVFERQVQPRWPPSPLVFLRISTHFTTTPGIPPPSAALKPSSIGQPLRVEPRDFMPDLLDRLNTLYAQ